MEYNPKDGKSLADSDTVLKQKQADIQLSTKKGIAFYCSKRHEFIFIENTKPQTLRMHKYVFTKEGTPKKEIAPNIRTKQWQD